MQIVNLADEKYKFRQFWIDLQKGYYSLLLKNYSKQVNHDRPDKKYVYRSQVKIMSDQRELLDHLEFAYLRVSQISMKSLILTIMYM